MNSTKPPGRRASRNAPVAKNVIGRDSLPSVTGQRRTARPAAKATPPDLPIREVSGTLYAAAAMQPTEQALLDLQSELLATREHLRWVTGQLENIQTALGVPLLVLDSQLCVERCNGPAASLFTLGAGAIGAPLNSIALPAGMPDFSAVVIEAQQQGQAQALQLSSGARHYTLHIRPSRQEGQGGSITLFLVDETDLRNTEDALRMSQLQLMTIMDQTLTTATLKDPAGRYIYVNRRFSEVFGIASIEALGHTDQQIFPAETADHFRRHDLAVMQTRAALDSVESASTPGGPVALRSRRFPL